MPSTTIPISPLTGPLDTRSTAKDLPAGSLRWRLNLRSIEQGRLCRGGGWTKFLTKGAYNNQDLHDQLLTFTDGSPRQPIIFQRSFETTRGVRKMFVATQSTIYRFNEWTGNYAVLGTGYGTSSTSANDYRWHVAQLGDFLYWTNSYNQVLVHAMEESSLGDPALSTIPDLETIGLTRAGVIWEFQNCVFLADVDMDGDRFAYRVVWSDYQNGQAWDPATVNSFAGFKDLYLNEKILGGLKTRNSFLIYTNRGVWELTAVGGDQSFAFRRIFNANEDQRKCLYYPNTLLAVGSDHIYMAKDRLYVFNESMAEPQLVKWLDDAAGELYRNLDENACNAHWSILDGDEVYFCVAKMGDANQCPSQTLRGNTLFGVADYIDFGFTAGCHFRPGSSQTIRDFIIDQKVCTIEELNDQGFGFTNEGLPNPVPDYAAPFEPQSIHTSQDLHIVIPSEGVDIHTEDYTKVESDSDSLCALMGNTRFDDICRACQTEQVFVMAASDDWCLKGINEANYREHCTNPTMHGTTGSLGYTSSTGTYVLNGYSSILRWPPGFTKDASVKASHFILDYIADAQQTPSMMTLRVGLSAQSADPNTDECRIVWRTLSRKPLKCISPSTAAEHVANNTSPSEITTWNFEYSARYVFFEWSVGGTGAGACWSNIQATFEPVSTRNYV